jgi:Flp pilus assembly pilin Flp
MPPIARPSDVPPKRRQRRFLADSRGQVAIEYTMIAAMTAVIAIGALTLFGDRANGVWAWISGEVTEAMTDE